MYYDIPYYSYSRNYYSYSRNTVLALAIALASITDVNAQQDGDTLVWGFESAANWESGMQQGQDLVVNIELPAAESKNAAQAQAGSMLWQWRGVARFAPDDADPEEAWRQYLQSVDDENEPAVEALAADAPTTRKWIAVNLETGFEYEVELSNELARSVGVYMEQGGHNMGNPGKGNGAGKELGLALEEAEDSGLQTQGWSKGTDTRTRRYNNTSYPYRTIGQMGGGTKSGCTGTLIGPRHILTAAHCLWNSSTDSWYSKSGTRFRPGREGTCNTSSCEPYGGFNARWYFTPAEFRQTDGNWTYDYGIMVTWGRPGDTTGWMGYVATSQSTLNEYCDKVPFGPGYLGGNCFNRGYPACGYVEAPTTYESCKQGWAYQDQNPCEVGSFIWTATAGDGWKSNFTVNCDLGRGHSGSAVFTDVWNGSGKVVFGVVSTQACATCSSNSTYPNRIRRVTPDVLDWISYFKTVKYP